MEDKVAHRGNLSHFFKLDVIFDWIFFEVAKEIISTVRLNKIEGIR